MKTGLIDSLPAAEYFAVEAASASLLKMGAKSWRKAKWQKDHPQQPTPAMVLGTRVHAAILEPETRYALARKPDGLSFATKEGKAWKEANPIFVTVEDADAIDGMVDSVWANPDAKELLSLKGRKECSAFAIDPETGMNLKSRFDFVSESDNLIVDVKTTDSASLFDWERTCAKFQYALQASFYGHVFDLITGGPIQGFIFIVVERTAPFECVCYQIGDASIAKGRKDYMRLLWEYRTCIESGKWPGLFEGVKTFDLPRWALNDEPDQNELTYQLTQ